MLVRSWKQHPNTFPASSDTRAATFQSQKLKYKNIRYIFNIGHTCRRELRDKKKKKKKLKKKKNDTHRTVRVTVNQIPHGRPSTVRWESHWSAIGSRVRERTRTNDMFTNSSRSLRRSSSATTTNASSADSINRGTTWFRRTPVHPLQRPGDRSPDGCRIPLRHSDVVGRACEMFKRDTRPTFSTVRLRRNRYWPPTPRRPHTHTHSPRP